MDSHFQKLRWETSLSHNDPPIKVSLVNGGFKHYVEDLKGKTFITDIFDSIIETERGKR
jgi:hypothetical protein